ncbi:T-cell surface glycoprotein CD8 alpha chain-like isoform X1 [Gallus gallus]|uniref:T-cell surface glycoprotein CD8 alpha chain-like isoform X1 n=1 Tax=Gallus gallus TaxID=9031 RepID=UPI001AE63958|nr:T-cell surface glycoprotein CD8 alpha chain-like isoform X1 [Gallus gallus]
MSGSPALLLLLSLGLCCTDGQGQRDAVADRFLNRNMKHPQEGQQLELECPPYDRDKPIFWIRLDKFGNIHFLVSSTPVSVQGMTFYGIKGTSSQFDTWWRGNTNLLVVKNFTTQDDGTYFCISYTNQVLHFSSGQPTFFPVATKAAPTTPATTTQSSQATKKDNSQQSPDAGTNSKNTLHFCYDVVMRVNLAGACLLLLTAITITITHCQSWINISQSILHSQTITENVETSFHQTVLPPASRNP